MNFWLLAIILNTLMCLMLCLACMRLDKKCWDLLDVIKGMSKRITDLEEKIKVSCENDADDRWPFSKA